MSNPAPGKHININLAKGIPTQQIFADRYWLEEVEGFKIIHFGRTGHSHASAGVSISQGALADMAATLKSFFEKVPSPRTGLNYEAPGFLPSSSITCIDMMFVSSRGSEGELMFSTFLLHDLALAGAKGGKAEQTIPASPVLLVRCPLAMVQSLIVRILAD